MISMILTNIPLTLGTVLIRRYIDHYPGSLLFKSTRAVVSTTSPSATTIALFSGALFCLYHQLRKGTLVKIGVGRRISSVIKNSRHTIQRRVKNNSWFLRNIDSCRRKCTDALFRIARQSKESLQRIQTETGNVAEVRSMPVFHHHCIAEAHVPPLENIYSNESFENYDTSNHDLRSEGDKKGQASLVSNNWSRRNRPVTRNSKNIDEEASPCNRKNRFSSRKRNKSEHSVKELETETKSPRTRNNSEERKQRSKRTLRKSISEVPDSPKDIKLKKSERPKWPTKNQKITRKTRSGRVYVYTL